MIFSFIKQMDLKTLEIYINADKLINNIPITYIYVIAQHPNNIIRFDILPIKIGYSDRLDDRIIKFKGEQWCTNPKYVRIFECEKKHGKPDKVFHKMFNELYPDNLIEMIDKNKELFKVNNLDIVDKVFNEISESNPKSKYYTDFDEIEELVNRESIIKDIVKNLVDDVISENPYIVSDNSGNLDTQSIDMSGDINEIIKQFIKLVYDPTKNKQDLEKYYLNKKYISIIAERITDKTNFIRLFNSPEDNKEEIIKILDMTYKRIKDDKDNMILKNAYVTYPKCILKIIIKYFESQ